MMEKNCNVINHTCKDSYLSLISENQDRKKMNELVSAPNTDDAHGPSTSKTWSRIWRVAQIWALMDVFLIQLEGSNMTSCQHGHTKWRFQSGLDFTNQDWKNVSELVFQVTSDRCWFLSKIWLRITRVAKIYYCFRGGFQWSYLQQGLQRSTILDVQNAHTTVAWCTCIVCYCCLSSSSAVTNVPWKP